MVTSTQELATIDFNYSSTASVTPSPLCSGEVPTAKELFQQAPITQWVLTGIAIFLSAATVGIFLEEIAFITRHFKYHERISRTIWVLAIYPMYSVTSLIGVIAPRSGTLIDLIANVYFATCLYQFVRLLVDYFGGVNKIWPMVEGTEVSLRAPPCCCCLFCLPSVTFDRELFYKLQFLVMQVAIVRPVLMGLAAVMWADGTYIPGEIAKDNAYIYIVVVNMVSSFFAVYGLLILKTCFNEALKAFNIGGKFISIQIIVLVSVLPNLIINILVQTNVIPCNEYMPSKARGDRLFHYLLVCLMLPISFLGRHFFRRKAEGAHFACEEIEKAEEGKELMEYDQQKKKKANLDDDINANEETRETEKSSRNDQVKKPGTLV